MKNIGITLFLPPLFSLSFRVRGKSFDRELWEWRECRSWKEGLVVDLEGWKSCMRSIGFVVRVGDGDSLLVGA